MFIERDGKKYELTAKELSDANTEFVTSWMKKTLEEDFDVPEEFSQGYAEWAYDRYSEGNGETEYECVEKAFDEYEKDKKEDPDSFGEDEEEIPKATCCNCYAYNNGYCDKFQSTVDADDNCDHLHGETIKKVYALGALMGYYDMEDLDAETLAESLGYDIEDIQIMDTI